MLNVKTIRFTTLIFSLVILVGAICSFPIFAANVDEGMTFTAEDLYQTESPLSSLPSTFEATLKFPTNTSGRGGVILGNYLGSGSACVNFEIHEKGVPRLYIIDDNAKTYDVKFTKVNVFTGEFVHLTIVKDSAAGTLSCYLNGELKETQTVATPSSVTFKNVMGLGGDIRSGNGQYFKGTLKNIAIYEDVRTTNEILADSKGTLDTNGLIGFYELSAGNETISDTTKNGPDFIYNDPFLKDYEGVSDYAYSFAVVGDTQILTRYYPEKLTTMYDWIVDNVESKKIKFVFGLGDITDTNAQSEWKIAKKEITKLDGLVPYSIIRGNHDRPEYYFNRFFPLSEFGKNVSGSFDDTMCNTYQEFTVGTIKYLVVNLDFGPSDKVLKWANEVVEKHPEHNVIVTTHIYIQGADGTTIDEGESTNAVNYGGINTGEKMWEKFISKHENIILVLCGHDPTDYITVSRATGDKGNEVVQMLVDPQGTDKNLEGVGLVAMLYFSNDGRHVDVEYYSTDREAFYCKENQFSLELNVIGSGVAVEPVETTDTASESLQETEPSKTEDGCGSSVSLIGLSLVAALSTCTAFVAKKKEK